MSGSPPADIRCLEDLCKVLYVKKNFGYSFRLRRPHEVISVVRSSYQTTRRSSVSTRPQAGLLRLEDDWKVFCIQKIYRGYSRQMPLS